MHSIHIVNTDRIKALDFTKGILVLFMIFYHGMNYLGHVSWPHHYLKFLPPSFIFITGFIITHISLCKYNNASEKLTARLLSRSGKILLLFTALNLCSLIIISNKFDGISGVINNYFVDWKAIYLIGSGRRTAFEILIPISYTLFLSVPILKLHNLSSSFIHILSISTVILCLSTDMLGLPLFNLYMISAGLMGMGMGLLPMNRIDRAANSTLLIICLFGLYWVFDKIMPEAYFTQMYATLVILILIYKIAHHAHLDLPLLKQVTLLGQYSLLSYIIQIFYLQIYFRYIAKWINTAYLSYSVIVILIILMWGTVYITEYARGKSNSIDTIYKAVFA
jgi:hypothetical protein